MGGGVGGEVIDFQVSWLGPTCTWGAAGQEHLAPGVPDTPGSATHHSLNQRQRKEWEGKEERSLFQRGQHWEDSRLASKTVSEVLKIPPGLHKENAKDKSQWECRWAAKGTSIGLGVSHGWSCRGKLRAVPIA